MERVFREGGSFRDPSGTVFVTDDRIFRSVSDVGAADYEYVRDSGFHRDLVAKKWMVQSNQLDPSFLEPDIPTPRYLLEHQKLPFISYPYEWCFSAMKAAALLQLDLLLEGLERDITLSDASAYNIQFRGPDPIFIDVLSFRKYNEGDYWLAHRQFCEQFLNPLLLTATRGIAFNAWFRGSLEGLDTEDLNKIVPWHKKISFNMLSHVVLPARLQSAARHGSQNRLDKAKERRLPRSAYQGLLEGLRKWIARLKPANSDPSTWGDYAVDNTYSDEEAKAKVAFVQRFAASVKPELLWDLGCNAGVYSEAALQAGAKEVIGFDFDQKALDKAFARAKSKGLALLPLFLDATNPSPGQGWRGLERKSLNARANADGILALAFIHHLAIGRNIPLEDAVAWLISLAPCGVIEFVEKDDPTVKQMLQLREDIFPNYHRDAFLAAVTKHASIVTQEEVTNDRRLLIWYDRRSD